FPESLPESMALACARFLYRDDCHQPVHPGPPGDDVGRLYPRHAHDPGRHPVLFVPPHCQKRLCPPRPHPAVLDGDRDYDFLLLRLPHAGLWQRPEPGAAHSGKLFVATGQLWQYLSRPWISRRLPMSNEYQDLLVAFALTSFIMPILLGGILIWFIATYQRKKYQHEAARKDALLREQTLLLEKIEAVEQERARIAAEMHDDLGAGLTTIRFLSDKAVRQAADAAEARDIRRIAEHSRHLVRNMSEIIWAMNARYDSTENLTGYLRRYATEY